jgi:hypothetical protein
MKAARVLAFVLVGIGAITGAVVFGQSPPPVQAKRPANSAPTDLPGGYVIQELAPGGPSFFAPQDQTAQLVDQYRKAEKEEDKKEIKKKLTDVLGQEFDAHMKHQQEELANLEKQINDLKALMKKRQDARTTIIDRHMDQLINDAEGLGWNAPGHPQHAGLWARPNPYYPRSATSGRIPADKK